MNMRGAMGGSKALVEFKAGRMNYDGRMVTPDRRKGILRIINDQHGMKTLQWLEAGSDAPVDSFFVFPDESKFEKVKQSNDRVYLFEIKATEQRNFYWMQETDAENDTERMNKVHNTLNNISEDKAKPQDSQPS